MTGLLGDTINSLLCPTGYARRYQITSLRDLDYPSSALKGHNISTQGEVMR